jgi:hypothetical protein
MCRGQVLASYSHNTHGQRIGKTLADGHSTQYLWGGGHLVGETAPKMATEAAIREGEFRLSRRYVYQHGNGNGKGSDVPALLQARRQAERGYRWGNGVELCWPN